MLGLHRPARGGFFLAAGFFTAAAFEARAAATVTGRA